MASNARVTERHNTVVFDLCDYELFSLRLADVPSFSNCLCVQIDTTAQPNRSQRHNSSTKFHISPLDGRR